MASHHDHSQNTPFTIDNIPYGVISTAENPTPRCATAFESDAIDLSVLEKDGFFKSIGGFDGKDIFFSKPHLNDFASLPTATRREVRNVLVEFLLRPISDETRQKYFVPLKEVRYHFPMATANFSDFYCALEHAQNCSNIMGSQVPSNWYYIPSVYNGRTSSLRVSGTPVPRPWGVVNSRDDDDDDDDDPKSSSSKPAFAPCNRLDFELEMGIFLSRPLPSGQILDIQNAKEHIFGFVILNDWSARDIQGFEMAPLGPFHSKGFGTTVSPWIVTIDALEAVQCRVSIPQQPPPLPHLKWQGSDEAATFDIELSAKIIRNGKSYTATSTNLNVLYWTPYQQLTHLASAGEGLSTGDIFGTGTISCDRTNPDGEKTGLACLFERASPKNALSVMKENGIQWLEDGDEVVMEGWCVNPPSGKRFGFGECRGIVTPALDL